jgi:hypothetical protein
MLLRVAMHWSVRRRRFRFFVKPHKLRLQALGKHILCMVKAEFLYLALRHFVVFPKYIDVRDNKAYS